MTPTVDRQAVATGTRSCPPATADVAFTAGTPTGGSTTLDARAGSTRHSDSGWTCRPLSWTSTIHTVGAVRRTIHITEETI